MKCIFRRVLLLYMYLKLLWRYMYFLSSILEKQDLKMCIVNEFQITDQESLVSVISDGCMGSLLCSIDMYDDVGLMK